MRVFYRAPPDVGECGVYISLWRMRDEPGLNTIGFDEVLRHIHRVHNITLNEEGIARRDLFCRFWELLTSLNCEKVERIEYLVDHYHLLGLGEGRPIARISPEVVTAIEVVSGLKRLMGLFPSLAPTPWDEGRTKLLLQIVLRGLG